MKLNYVLHPIHRVGGDQELPEPLAKAIPEEAKSQEATPETFVANRDKGTDLFSVQFGNYQLKCRPWHPLLVEGNFNPNDVVIEVVTAV